jgi:periplasmic protein CpxP/Spy
MKVRRFTYWVMAVALAGLMAVPAIHAGAQIGGEERQKRGQRMGPRGFGPGFGPGAPLGELRMGLRQLDLSDHQREQIRGILTQNREEFQQIAQRMRALHQELRQATSAEVVNEAAVREITGRMAEVQADAAILRARVRNDVFQQLTPEQQEKARQLQSQTRERFEQRRQRFQNRGPGL